MSIPANIKYILLSLVFALATINFTRTTLEILKSSQRLEDVNSEVAVLGAKKEQLEKDLQFAKTDEFVEEKARNELNMVKPGEQVFVVSKAVSSGAEVKGVENTVNLPQKASKNSGQGFENAKRWFELVF